jgi:multisubunit Na+/H+ antiporter MnhC subunit
VLSTLLNLECEELTCIGKYILFRDKNVSVMAVLKAINHGIFRALLSNSAVIEGNAASPVPVQSHDII